MAHMWFGDLVTMKWWDDLWLNESFAEWACYHAAVEATEFTESWTGFTNARKNWAYRQDQLPSTHPIAADNVDLRAVEVNFDGITYAKGASVLKQLVAWVGLENFLDRSRRATSRTSSSGTPSSPTCSPRSRRRPGRELDTWAQEWLQTSGVNTLAPEFELDADGSYASFARTPDRRTPTTRRCAGTGSASACTTSSTATSCGVRSFEIDVEGDLTEVAELVGQQQPDLLLLNDGDLAYAKIRLDERSLATVDRRPGHARRLAGPGAVLGRGVGHDPRRRDERHRLRHAGAQRASARETDAFGVSRIPGYGAQAVNTYSAPENRAALKATWEQGLRDAARRRRAGQRPPAVVRARLRRRRAQRRGARRRSRACSTARCPSTGSRSTPTCAGTC